jgi:hypothetical protein
LIRAKARESVFSNELEAASVIVPIWATELQAHDKGKDTAKQRWRAPQRARQLGAHDLKVFEVSHDLRDL